MRSLCLTAMLLTAVAVDARAATISFLTDPFDGSTALTTPGRQVVGGEPFINFDVAQDVFAFNETFFAVDPISFFNGEAAAIPATGVNTVVLRTFDNDADPLTAFGAGNAANLIAAQITAPGAGFFIYFNSNLDLARLVYSTDLNDNTSDLKILARLLNFSGQDGRDAMATVTSANFEVLQAVPEPGTIALLATGLVFAAAGYRRRSKRQTK
jgi:hypothetical protein